MKGVAAMDAQTARNKRNGPWREAWRRLKKSKTAMLGLVIITLLVLMAIFADVLADASLTTKIDGRAKLQPPSAEHWFGTDHLGRDLFARIVHGSRISLSMGLFVVAVAVTTGSVLGAMCGYYGGAFDSIMMRFFDIMYCIPTTLLTMVIVTTLGTGLINLLIALCIGSVPGISRLVRSTVISLAEVEYIQSAKAFGSSDAKIILRHIMPNAMGMIIVQATGMVAGTIIAAAGMSFLGFGVQPPTAEWGVILSDSRNYMLEAPHLMLIPGVAIIIAAMSITLVGDGLRDALDPRLKD